MEACAIGGEQANRLPRTHDILTAEEVIRILRLDDHAPRAPRESLRNLVRGGQLPCLRLAPGKRGRMIFLRRHVEQFLDRCEQWGRRAPAQ